MTTEERLEHDVKNGISNLIAGRASSGQFDVAKTIAIWRSDIAESVIKELRMRWTIVERPRKQKTLRQEV